MNTVTLDHVYEALSAWTGIPAERLRTDGVELGDPAELRAALKEAIIGQDEAIDAVVRAMSRRARLAPRAEERRPLWSALFVGPSGVGKSQLAKELAQVYFGDSDRHLVQVDLSDFRDEHTVARLVGAPPGYKGHGDGGELTNALRRVPTGVLLLDEIEKAHPVVRTQVLLPLLGEGAVHDMNDGRVLDASQFIVIMTSNLGAGWRFGKPVGFGAVARPHPTPGVRQAVADQLPNEIRGRIDEVLVFAELSEGAVRALWEREIRALGLRLCRNGVEVHVDVEPAVRDRLLASAAGRIRAEGARAVRKLVDRVIANNCIGLLEGPKEPVTIEVAGGQGSSIAFRRLPISRG